jgi:SAM-dependent methyltransferase
MNAREPGAGAGARTLPKDVWASGASYEPYVGRWSRRVAREFLSWLGAAPGRRWLDVGCGTGALSQTILAQAAPGHILGVDRARGFAAFARVQLQDPRVQVAVGDAQALPVVEAGFDVIVSGLVLNFIPNPRAALAEICRAARPGGVVAAYVWDYAGEMQLMRHFWDAAVALDPQALELDEGRRFPLCQPDALAELFHQAGLQSVETRDVTVATDFANFDDYWSPFLGGQGPAPTYTLSLGEQQQAALRERLRQQLPVAPDGSIHLVARAWAVRGMR